MVFRHEVELVHFCSKTAWVEPFLRDCREELMMPAEFVATLGDESQLPLLFNGRFIKGRDEPRLAMLGRSNVGKSSLINALTGSRLAQTSNQPGKTRAIHFYLWKDAGRIIADLPGYGYASASKAERERWARFIDAYLGGDEGLEAAVVLLDARHGPTELDLQAIEFLKAHKIPVIFVFSKSDQLKTQSERALRRKETSLALRGLGYEPEQAFWLSVKTRDGLAAFSRLLGAEWKRGR